MPLSVGRGRENSKAKFFHSFRLKPQRLLFIISNQNMTRRISTEKYYHNNEPLQFFFVCARAPLQVYLCMRYENDGWQLMVEKRYLFTEIIQNEMDSGFLRVGPGHDD